MVGLQVGKSVDEVIAGALMHGAHPYNPAKYDPQKAHDYYEAHKNLKGRPHGSKEKDRKGRGHGAAKPAAANKISPAEQKQIDHLKSRLSELQTRLHELLANAKKNSHKKDDHKTAADKSKDARDAKKYREKHKTELAANRKHDSGKSGGGGGGHASGVGSMTEAQVRAAIARTRENLQAAIANARRS